MHATVLVLKLDVYWSGDLYGSRYWLVPEIRWCHHGKMMTVVMATLPAPTVTASYSCVFHDDVDTASDVMFAFLSSPSTVLWKSMQNEHPSKLLFTSTNSHCLLLEWVPLPSAIVITIVQKNQSTCIWGASTCKWCMYIWSAVFLCSCGWFTWLDR